MTLNKKINIKTIYKIIIYIYKINNFMYVCIVFI